ncbi:RNA polymerase sigma factor SigZ [Motiliproteus coralliicola]|uniref:RNA polymerase sigma factor SigZ n=1 Tax=Motiliproteus coralliicola TaxID=2283196 RepID=A0A369WSD8_9GAMM|nr:RNA polymerase sigma factor SigZ [Motiliproteus coralliicola]RDE25018.1 RNA polymerase sigma factor SigZ [Motiliproteus coralliicola]
MTIEQIWQEYSASLKRLLQSKVANPADVDDLLQEVLIKTHQQIAGLRGADRLKPWLYTLTRNVVIDFYRRRGRQNAWLADEPQAGEQRSEGLWFDNEPVALQQLGDCVKPFIDGLDAEAAALLRAVDIDGRSQKALAEELGVSYSTLKSRVQRARLQLRQLFEGCCAMELDHRGNLIGYQPHQRECRCC